MIAQHWLMFTAQTERDIELFCSQQNQVSAYFTRVQILSIESAVTNKKEAVTSA